MELRKTSELIEVKIPKFKSVIDVMEHSINTVLNDGNILTYSTAFKFNTNVVNEPVTLAMLEIGVVVYRVLPENEENCFQEYLNIWADVYNMARMEDKHSVLDLSLGTILVEFDRYMSGKNVWHNLESFDKFLS